MVEIKVGTRVKDNDPRGERTGTILEIENDRVRVRWDQSKCRTWIARAVIGKSAVRGYTILDEGA